MWDFNLLSATQALEKTMAYMVYRLAMYLVFSFVLIFGIIAGSGTGLIVDSLITTTGFFAGIGGTVGFAVFCLVLYSLRGTRLYSLKAPHLVLLNASVDEAIVQHGWAQVVHARQQIRERFPSATDLSKLDRRIKAVLAHEFRRCTELGKKFAQPGESLSSTLISSIWAAPAASTHEVIIAECLKQTDRPPGSVALDSLVLYAQNFNRLFKNALSLLTLKYLITIGLWILMLSPVGWIDELIPVEFGSWQYVFGLLLAWPLKSALLDPIALVALRQVYSDLTRGQQPDAGWEAQLANESAEFASIKKQAEFIESEQLASQAATDEEPRDDQPKPSLS